ncbi:MAG: hypothetical protein NTZ38_03150 [Candidatus Taylorbacteria bacterium]|nr:hypothetical protein [Candidatus Taylorbacteria bacterium]
MPRRVEDIRPKAQDERESFEPVHIKRIPAEAYTKRKKISLRTKEIIGGIVVVFFLIVFFGYLASTYFARAIFTVTPKTVSVSVISPIMAFGTAVNGQLSYELKIATATVSMTVPATDSPSVQTKAAGTIMIYNAYSAEPRRLIAGTRLVNDVGNIYRLNASVTIPGYKRSSTGIVTPGKVSTPIIADQVGVKYNISRADRGNTFMVVAYASTTKYSAIYGKTVGEIIGGSSGNRKVVSASVMASTTDSLQSMAVSDLTRKLKRSIPAGYIAPDQFFIPRLSSPIISGDRPKEATISIAVTVYAIIFKQNDLISKLAGTQAIQTFDGSAFDTIGLDKLSVSISNLKDFSPEKKSGIVMQVKGDLKLVGTIPVDQIKSEFSGLSLADTQNVMQRYSHVVDLERSNGQVVPPWAKVPKNVEKISIIIQK